MKIKKEVLVHSNGDWCWATKVIGDFDTGKVFVDSRATREDGDDLIRELQEQGYIVFKDNYQKEREKTMEYVNTTEDKSRDFDERLYGEKFEVGDVLLLNGHEVEVESIAKSRDAAGNVEYLVRFICDQCLDFLQVVVLERRELSFQVFQKCR